MLELDEIILNLLLDAKNKGGTLLDEFHIDYPNKRVAEESNSIFVACMSSESQLEGYDFEKFRDLCEILIVTKQLDYKEAITVIKTVTKTICNVIMSNIDKFPNKPVIRNINPEFNYDFVLTRGHIMVQCNSEPETFDVTDEEFKVCKVLLDTDNIKIQ